MKKNKPEVSIWHKSDFPEIKKLALQTWFNAYGSFLNRADIQNYHKTQYSDRNLKQYYEKYIGLVCKIDDKIVGYSVADAKYKDKYFHIISLYVNPEFQKHGCGKHLLQSCVNIAEKKGFKVIQLGVFIKNTKAIDWYIAQGFTFDKKEDFIIGNSKVDLLIGKASVAISKTLR